MFLLNAPPRQPRLPAFAGSLLLHGTLVVLLSQVSFHADTDERVLRDKQYSVSFVHLQMPSQYVRKPAPAPEKGKSAEPGKLARLATPSSAAPHADAPAPKSEPAALTEPAPKRQPRQFQLPPSTRTKPVTQTLVQMDVPPDVVLPIEIPLPTVLSWNETKLRAPKKQFVAPPVKKVTPAQSLPASPVLEAPNQEIAVGSLNMATTPINDSPRLVRLPTIAAPVSSAGAEPAREIPQVGLANSNQPAAANLISQPNTPLRASGVVVLPPANQVAPGDRASGGGADGGTGNGQAGSGTPGPTPGVRGSAEGRTPGLPGSTDGRTQARGSGSGKDVPGASSGGNMAGVGAPGGNGAADRPGGTDTSNIPGLTRITQPPDGKFAAVVLGSLDSTRYPESAGVLAGKIIYTVYLRVGMRKNWILQYGLPKAAGRNLTGTGGTPIDAPWPVLMMRPDQLAAQPNYVMVHGLITTTGEFDQLSMVFPTDFEKKDLLLGSLKLWKFRPARRDGEAAAVEILLTIPRQTD